MREAASEQIQMAEYFRVLSRRWKIILFVVVTAGVVSWMYASTRRAEYVAVARYEIKRYRFDPTEGLERVYITSRDQRTFAEVAKSEEVVRSAAERLAEAGWAGRLATDSDGLRRIVQEGINVQAVEGVNVLEVTARAPEPALSADIANVLGEVLRDRFLSIAAAEKARLQSFLDGEIRKYEARIEELQTNLAQLDARDVARAKEGLAPTPARFIEIRREVEEAAKAVERVHAERARVRALLEDPGRFTEEDLALLTAGVRNPRAPGAFAAWEEAERRRKDLSLRYTEAHPSYQAAEEEVARRLDLLREAVRADAEKRIEVSTAQEAEVSQTLAAALERQARMQQIFDRLPEERLERSNLEQELSSALSLYRRLQERKSQNEVQLSNVPQDEMRAIDRAVPPREPVYPNVPALVFMGCSVGLLVGFALAFFLESLDTAISTVGDVERLTGKPVLAIVPPIRMHAAKAEEVGAKYGLEEGNMVPVLADPRSPASESFRTLRTVLDYRFFEQGKKVLLVTSATPGEGKSTTLANLAYASASAGRETVVVAANLRHPVIGRFIPSAEGAPGISDFLAGEADLAETVQETSFPGLSLIDAGRRLSRPAELLASPLLPEALAALAERYDVVLIDSPPVLPVADAATIAPHADGVLLVYYVGVPPRGAVQRAVTTLEATGGRVVGVVLNDIREASIEEFTHYYYYQRYPLPTSESTGTDGEA